MACHDTLEFTDDELHAVIDEAHRNRLPITAHATFDDCIRRVAEFGVDCIEHGGSMSDETIQLLLDKKIPIVTTFSALVIQSKPEIAGAFGIPEWKIEERQRAVADKTRFDGLVRAAKAGVPIVFGTDAGSPAVEHHQIAPELGFMVEVGVCTDSLDALRAITARAAVLNGFGDSLGTLEPGKAADLIVVDGRPDEDLDSAHKGRDDLHRRQEDALMGSLLLQRIAPRIVAGRRRLPIEDARDCRGLDDVIALGRGIRISTPPPTSSAAKGRDRRERASLHRPRGPAAAARGDRAIYTAPITGWTTAADEIMVTAGVQESIMLCMLGLVKPGDEVLITSPRLRPTTRRCSFAAACPMPVPTVEKDDFALDVGRDRKPHHPDKHADVRARLAQQPHRRRHPARRDPQDRSAGGKARHPDHRRRDLCQADLPAARTPVARHPAGDEGARSR